MESATSNRVSVSIRVRGIRKGFHSLVSVIEEEEGMNTAIYNHFRDEESDQSPPAGLEDAIFNRFGY